MRLMFAFTMAAMLSVAPATAAPKASKAQVSPKPCDRDHVRLANSGQVRVFRHSREFPPADLHHAVVRHVDNCPVPAIVRRNVGR